MGILLTGIGCVLVAYAYLCFWIVLGLIDRDSRNRDASPSELLTTVIALTPTLMVLLPFIAPAVYREWLIELDKQEKTEYNAD